METRVLFRTKEEMLMSDIENTTLEIEKLQENLNKVMNRTVDKQIKLRDHLNYLKKQLSTIDKEKKIMSRI